MTYRGQPANATRDHSSGKMLATAAVAMALLTACAPMSSTFYRPDPGLGRVVKAWCPPIQSVILVETRGVTVGFELYPIQEGVLLARISFEIPDKHSVQLVDHFIEVGSPNQRSAKVHLSGHVWASPWRTEEIPLDAPMNGRTETGLFGQTTRYGRTKHAYYLLQADISMTHADQLVLKTTQISGEWGSGRSSPGRIHQDYRVLHRLTELLGQER
ncbi:MAG: hypothetical protein KatS3mg123_3301 [Burkholderiales bacterium]|nr:MAG: hypothetical protein KatS3mg123_3301 [Burkholderiales bacterium]